MKKILVLDDCPNMRHIIGVVLEFLGVKVDFAASGKEALAQLKTQTYDLLITDIYMAEPNGLSVLRWVQRYNPSQRCLVVTGWGHEESSLEDRQEILNLSDGLLQKPFDMNELSAAVTKLLESDRKEKLVGHGIQNR